MGTLTFQAALGGSVNLLGPNTASNINFTLPSADGSSGQPLQTNGSGTLSFANLAIANGGTGVTSFTANQIHYGSFSQSAGLTFDGTNFATTGTATAAKLIPTGSSATGNGLYLPAANSLGISTNGTNAVYIDSSQNVGIGTTSPDVNLDVTKTSDGVAARFQRSSGGGVVDIETYNGIGGIGTNDNIPFRLNTNNTERMRIDSSGNVGIGQSSPQSKLDVRAANVVTDAIGQVSIYANDFGANYGGSIGLGGAYNTALTTFTDYTQIAGRKENSTSGDYAGYLSFATRINSGAITERMRIDSSGNVGIGTTSPSASAILDAQSTTKGVRMPNMTTTQKNAISSPAAGLMVFDTTLAKLSVYSGTAWQTITSV